MENSTFLIPGNLIKKSDSENWHPDTRGSYVTYDPTKSTMQDGLLREFYSMVHINDDILRGYGFYVDKTQAHIKYNAQGDLFKLNKIDGCYHFSHGDVLVITANHLENLYFMFTNEILVFNKNANG